MASLTGYQYVLGASSSAHPPVEPDATLKTTAKAKTPAKPKNDKGKKKLLQRLLIKTVEDAVDAALNGVVDSENKDVSADESVDTMIIKRKSDGNFQRVVKPPKRPRNVMSIDRKRKRSDSESSTTRNVTVGTASSKKKFRDPNFDRETRSKSSHVRPPSSDEEDTPDAPKDIHEVLKAGNERNNVEK